MSEQTTPLDDAETREAMLEAEVARLRAEVERLTREREGFNGHEWNRLLNERDAAIGERDRLRDTLLAKHGGEPLALLAELDAARAGSAALRARVEEAERLLALVSEDGLGGTPDLFWPFGGWDAFFERVAAFLASSDPKAKETKP